MICGVVAAATFPADAPAQTSDLSHEAGFEYLLRVGKLNLDYERFETAADALELACTTREGVDDFECYRLWATAAEKAHRIDDALQAWDGAEAVAEQGNTLAREEAGRLRSVYGEVVLHAPWGTSLPSLPLELVFNGLLLDPELKDYLETITLSLGSLGLEDNSLFLPGGGYEVEDLAFTVVPGERIELLLPEALVSYRSAGLGVSSGDRAVAGPGSVGLSLQPAALVVVDAGVGVLPALVGVQIRLGRRQGPLRLEVHLRTGVVPVVSMQEPPSEERSGGAWFVLGQGDVGVDLQATSGLQITPHLGAVGGTLGSLLVGCTLDEGSVRWEGECVLPTAVGGVQLGVTLSVLLGSAGAPARTELRAGVHVDVLRVSVLGSQGDGVGPGLLHEVAVEGFAAIAPGGEVGVSFRF